MSQFQPGDRVVLAQHVLNQDTFIPSEAKDSTGTLLNSEQIGELKYGVVIWDCNPESRYYYMPGSLVLATQQHETKATNPKDSIGSDKLPLHLWPTTATALGSVALLNGALKYGRSNFREIGVRASIYADAAQRHLSAWFEGEECDPDDGVPHLGAVLACVAILVDAEAAGKLNDDRMVKGGYRQYVDSLTPHVKRLKELHASKSPKHYTIADNKSDS